MYNGELLGDEVQMNANEENGTKTPQNAFLNDEMEGITLTDNSIPHQMIDLPENLSDLPDFQKENRNVLRVILSPGEQMIAIKDSMLSYIGSLKFKHKGKTMKKVLAMALTPDAHVPLMTVTNYSETEHAAIFFSRGRHVIPMTLNGSIIVNSNSLLCFDPVIDYEIKMMKSVKTIVRSGLFQLFLNGQGRVALVAPTIPITMRVKPDRPVRVDVNCAVAWSASLDFTFKFNFTKKDFIGLGSGEQIQLEFSGDGFVMVAATAKAPVLGGSTRG
ncbi:hypothetical protein J8273_5267 [Carpediemonas membranifera]|uniref:Mitochondrial biogenesis protein AIM24 n=1 Tax=Carpediemonas membranifera TaxID=201153 RepID=A0A8J6ARP8_9EUKA|nr:Mitochondrial biogenesis protein AIM24 [Carpediemonas membranifera]KAG9392278.1 hypothetical protein J8273_5267 [Carpediemonas membranifera]|eukprot:KAG9392268.1 Mitochondrial biogenesis protein AIM24 [Carpediemonas membranifera]